MNPAHKALREGTAAAHDRVDAAFAGFDLTDRDGYRRFLTAHAEVVWALEAALPGERLTPDWEERKRGALLREDLAFLRGPGQEPAAVVFDESWDDAAIAGALYVLEGSRLGGRFLARGLPTGFPRAYLDSNQPPALWRSLLDRIDAILTPDRLEPALAAAHRIFLAFEHAAARWAKNG
ncbi:biliverdin-producing heme oxygenase [Sphingomonas sp. HF-S4]|uniref:Biliverdin-producing heme oxygenase n=1 Tax=Sphingomonas agrestis TaxID=3080540 RepID=A0ABU3Y2L5_9SPHN|nr:biliverdin-producing heme oxygenase [Sphingomonas sp. HF-S4]MDV3455437.1 biliverdin-producing heme oxygenase [Sphingomonas sp. HF-S4]